MKLRLAAVLALGLSMVGGAAQAQFMGDSGTYGWYLRGEGGWNHTRDLQLSPSVNTPFGSAYTTENEGYIVGGAVGYGLGTVRIELNLDYRSNDVNNVSILGTTHSGGGTVEGTSAMANVLFDLPYNWMGFQPYIGVGAGAVRLDLSAVTAGGAAVTNDSQIVGALQGLAGVRYKLTPQWGLGLEYRFLNGFQPGPYRAAGGGYFNSSDYRNHSVLLSITYSFGAPPPPPPAPMPAAAPAPMPAPAAAPVVGARQLFLVFFDFDKSNITDAGRQVLDAAAAAVKSDQAVRIELTGYTDTVGTQQYNLGLSERRADAVRDYLSKQGIPANRMNVAWKGKEDLRVPTPDGVREPQNRRVEIVLP
jgi:OmpA-OmpF porin, OOP family